MIELFKKFKNDNLKKITNVYQLKYKNSDASGIGDYIRGSFTLLQMIQHINLYSGKNIVFDMDIKNHPISKYIISNNNDSINYDDLNIYHNQNLAKTNTEHIILNSYNFVEDFIHFLNNLEPNIGNYCAFICSFEIFDVFPVEHRNIIKSKLQPNIEMKKYIDEVMMDLGITKHSYNVIHIRCPDEVSFNNESLGLINSYLEKIQNYVRKNITNGEKYLLVSNNSQVKTHLTNYFENIFTFFNKISHLAFENTQTNDSVKGTLLDFYLIGYSKNVKAFSSYIHGTGFSKETCKVFNVPYSYTYIPITDDDESSKVILNNAESKNLVKKYSVLYNIQNIFIYLLLLLVIVILIFLYVTNIINNKKIKKWFDNFIKTCKKYIG